MTNKYFTVEVKPDIVMGDVSDVYASDDGIDLNPDDLISDWTAVDVPRGANAIRNLSLIVNNADGGNVNPATDFVLIFAKEANGVAPGSIKGSGFGNAPAFNGNIREHVIGAIKIEGTAADTVGIIPTINDTFGFTMHQIGPGTATNSTTTSNISTIPLPMIIDLEPTSGTNVGFDKLYVALINSTGTHSFETNVLADYSSGAPAADSTTTIVVKTTDPRLLFSVGDSVYNGTKHGSTDTAIGVVKSLTATSIELEANNAVAIADEDEIINGNPIRIMLGFER